VPKPNAAPTQNLVIHGTEATGKTAITAALLAQLAASTVSSSSSDAGGQTVLLQHAIVNSIESITGRHLFERALGKVADAVGWDNRPSRCETLAQFTVEMAKMLKYADRPARFRFVLVFDAIDRQREAPPTMFGRLFSHVILVDVLRYDQNSQRTSSNC